MLEKDVERRILKGVEDGERAADVMYMCKTIAEMRYARGQDFRADLFSRNFLTLVQTPSRRTRLLYGAGLVLCPIFEPVKHERYREHMHEMKQVRLQYANISHDRQLSKEFRKRVLTGIAVGAFHSLEMAEKLELWEILRPRGLGPKERRY